MYVNQLNSDMQARIKAEVTAKLKAIGLTGDELDDMVNDAMSSRLDDLSDIIDIKRIGAVENGKN